MNPGEILAGTVAAAQEAGTLLMGFLGRLEGVEYKGEVDLVTEADRESPPSGHNRVVCFAPNNGSQRRDVRCWGWSGHQSNGHSRRFLANTGHSAAWYDKKAAALRAHLFDMGVVRNERCDEKGGWVMEVDMESQRLDRLFRELGQESGLEDLPRQ